MANISSEIETLFSKIRINFLFNHPFLSVLALSIPTTFEENKTSAFFTNGHKISIDINKLSKYSDDEITYLYAHTLLHIVLKHPSRKGARKLEIWNQACDIVTNLVLETFSDVGTIPLDEMHNKKYKDKSAEEVYEALEKQKKKRNKVQKKIAKRKVQLNQKMVEI